MIDIAVKATQIQQLIDATKKAGKSFPREMAAAINATAKKTRLEIGREVRKHAAIPKKESEKPLSIPSVANAQKLNAVVRLQETARLGLRHFGAKQDASGVSYKISPRGGRVRVDGAFQGPKPGLMKVSWKGNAFKRLGKSRLPIKKLYGVSAWGVYTKNNLSGPRVKEISAELEKQIQRRINLNILRANGLVPSKGR